MNSPDSSSQATCVIPARSGSKRIPRKNLLRLGNEPALGLTIKALRASRMCGRIVVSTDSEEIAQVAIQYGAEVPFIRSEDLSNDFATTADVVRDAILRLGASEMENVLCAYPLSLLDPTVIVEFFKGASSERFHVTLGKLKVPPERVLSVDNTGMFRMSNFDALNLRTQDLSTGFYDAGKMYLAPARLWMQKDNMLSDSFSGHILKDHEAIDVDTPQDWEMVQRLRGS